VIGIGRKNDFNQFVDEISDLIILYATSQKFKQENYYSLIFRHDEALSLVKTINLITSQFLFLFL